MPTIIISEYQSGRVVFALEGAKDEIYLLEPYIKAYQKIARIENQYVVRHPDGSETDTAGEPVSPDASPLLFQFKVQRNSGKIILNMDISENTPGTRLGINQIENYASKLAILEQHLFSWVQLKPKVELTGIKMHETHLSYDREKLDYKNRLAKKDLIHRRLNLLLNLAVLIGAVASIVLVALVPVLSWFIIPAIIIAVVAGPIGFFGSLYTFMDWLTFEAPSEEEMLKNYNKHFGALCTKAVPLHGPAAVYTPKIEQSSIDAQKAQTQDSTEANPSVEEREPSKSSMSCDI